MSDSKPIVAVASDRAVEMLRNSPSDRIGRMVPISSLVARIDHDRQRLWWYEEALREIIEKDGHFHQEGGILDGPFAKIARAALDRRG
jgi:hypothetical protein